MNLFCTQCGSKLEPEANFCLGCGAPVAAAPAPLSPLTPPTMPAPPIMQTPPVAPPAPIEQVPPIAPVAPPASPASEVGSFPEPDTFSPTAPPPVAPVAPVAPVTLGAEDVPAFYPQTPAQAQEYGIDYTPVEGGYVQQEAQPAPAFFDGRVEVGAGAGTGEGADADAAPKMSTGKKVLLTVASVLTAIILFGAITAGQSWFIVRSGLNNETVKSMTRAVIEKVDLSEFSISGLVEQSSIEFSGDVIVDEGKLLHETIYSSIDEYYKVEKGVTEDKIKELLENNKLRTFLGDIIDGGVDYILGGEDGNIVSSSRIVKLIKDNAGVIESTTGYRLVDTDFDDIEAELKKAGINDLTWGSVIGDSADGGAINSARKVLGLLNSILIIIAIAVVIAALTALLVVLNNRRISNTLLYFGIPAAVSGAVVVAAAFFVNLLFNAIADGLDFVSSSVIRDSFADTKNAILFTGLITLGVGLAAVAVKIVIGVVRGKKKAV